MQRLPISKLHVNGGTQTRAHIDDETVREYAAAMEEGASFPPIVVFYDGADHWTADGFHRIQAYQMVGFTDIDCDVRAGTRRDAILYAVGANASHGLRRTNEDKRRAVRLLLEDREWGQWSDHAIARASAVSQQFVSKMRGQLTTVVSSTRLGIDGKTRDVSGIGRKPAAPSPAPAADEGATEAPARSLTVQPNMPITDGNDAEPARPDVPGWKKAGDNIRVVEGYSQGLEFAVMAIAQMERIHPKDRERKQAFAKVRAWLDSHE